MKTVNCTGLHRKDTKQKRRKRGLQELSKELLNARVEESAKVSFMSSVLDIENR